MTRDAQASHEAADREKAHLAELETKGGAARVLGYLRLMGPGYMQSAMTLGGGTAGSEAGSDRGLTGGLTGGLTKRPKHSILLSG